MRLMPALFFATAWTCLALPTSIAQQTDVEALREEIRTAWADRREGIKTLRVEATVAQFIPGTRDSEFGDINPEETSSKYLNIKWDFTYLRTGKNRWLQLHTDEHLVQAKPLTLKPYTVTFGFDGKETRTLLYGGLTPMPSCQIEQGHAIAGGSSYYVVQIWSELDEKLEQWGWQPDRMTLESPAENIAGAKLVRFRLPRNSDRWASTLELDPEHGWIPIRWKYQFDGQPRFSLKLLYDMSDAAEPKISGWKVEQYYGQGKLGRSEVVQINKLEINQPIADEEFEVPFPAGLPILTIDEKGRRHIVLPRKDRKDKDKPIPEDESQFGKSEE